MWLEALETDQAERLAMFLTPIRPPLRDRKFADSLLEGEGFEPSVPPFGKQETGCALQDCLARRSRRIGWCGLTAPKATDKIDDCRHRRPNG